ncbi:LytR/AlgR family response regulator transcription factor [Candidatus Stoquefichus massiliensis]|uniref:LytR/AlgR family response regulator transcription factor n=1 Tax=Candidatus Stoquefichus massiliensis TaxID=1470350 RepID=UPI00047F3FE4|nr:LytTR family DNA-binding domain-containing protein [Candidatus Stoquefichus massiliensis]
MNVVIADDDLSFIEKMKSDVLECFSFLNQNDPIELLIFTSDFYNILSLTSIEIIFVDIDLQTNYSGLNLIKHLKRLFPNMITIFISLHDEFVFPALSIGFFQFIRKSKYETDAPKVFKQAKDFFINNIFKVIITSKGRKVSIKLGEIIFILSIGHDILVKTTTQDYTIISSLEKFMNGINYRDLIQIERNLVINFNYTKDVKKSKVIMIDDEIYTVGRKYQNNLINEYELFLLR